MTCGATIAATGQTRSLDFDLSTPIRAMLRHGRHARSSRLLNPATRAFVTAGKPSLLMGVHFRDDAWRRRARHARCHPSGGRARAQPQPSKLSVICAQRPAAAGRGLLRPPERVACSG